LNESGSTAETVHWVFHRWRDIHYKPRARMDTQRAKVIRDRLRDGYSPQDLELAIYGCKFSDFHQGANDRGEKYDSITLILRNADQVEKFIDFAERAIAGMKRRQAAQAEQQTAQPAERNPDGDAYRAFLEQATKLGVRLRTRT
jgi:hypothetical protein